MSVEDNGFTLLFGTVQCPLLSLYSGYPHTAIIERGRHNHGCLRYA